MPDTEIPQDYISVNVKVENYKFIFVTADTNILYSETQYKFDVSDESNKNYHLRFTKDLGYNISYNTIPIGTPGTKNACVYFFSPNYTDLSTVYLYDENTNNPNYTPNVGDVYNPITITMTPTYRNLNKQREFTGQNFSLNKNNYLALITYYNSWEKINLETDSTSEFHVDSTQTLRNIYIDNSNDTLISFVDNSGVYFVQKYSNDDSYSSVLECSRNDLYFGDSIVEFDNKYIISSYGNNSIHIFDNSLNYTNTISYQGGGEFGSKLVSSSDFLFVSAPLHNYYQGCVLVYDTDLINTQTIAVENAILFGKSISVNDSNLLEIGSKNSVYEYVFDGTNFNNNNIFYPPETTQYEVSGTSIYENFGNQVVIDEYNQYIYISNSSLDYNSGVVYAYQKFFNYQTQIQKITTNPQIRNNHFGISFGIVII